MESPIILISRFWLIRSELSSEHIFDSGVIREKKQRYSWKTSINELFEFFDKFKSVRTLSNYQNKCIWGHVKKFSFECILSKFIEGSVYSYWVLNVWVSLLRAMIFGIWALYITCDSMSYSVIIFEIIIILFILSLLPNISYSVIKLPIIIIPDCTITDHTITDWSYYFLVLIPKVLLPISTMTFCSYPELCYYR